MKPVGSNLIGSSYSLSLLNSFAMSFHISHSFSMPTNAPNEIKGFVWYSKKQSRQSELVLCTHLHITDEFVSNSRTKIYFFVVEQITLFFCSAISFSCSLNISAVRLMFVNMFNSIPELGS